MLIRVETLGSIEEGRLFIIINGERKEYIPNKIINGNRCFRGTIDVDAKKVYQIIVEIEKDGLIASRYDIGKEQNRSEFQESIYDFPYDPATYPYKQEKRWFNSYHAPIHSDTFTARNATEDLAFEALERLRKIYDYAKQNPDEIEPYPLDLAIEIVKAYSGWRGDLQ